MVVVDERNDRRRTILARDSHRQGRMRSAADSRDVILPDTDNLHL